MTINEIVNKYGYPVDVQCTQPGTPSFRILRPLEWGQFLVEYKESGKRVTMTSSIYVDDYEVVGKVDGNE